MPRAVLIGPPGSGKSSVGEELAKILGCEFVDSDTQIVARSGKAIAEIFLDDGEATFRSLEREVVGELLQSTPGVLSLGGGAILDPDSQKLLAASKAKGTEIIYLHIELTTAVQRVGLNKDRPMLLLNPRQQWNSLMAARRHIYESLATQSFSTDGASAHDVAALIAEKMG